MTFYAGKRKKGRGICLGDGDHDCLTNLRFADEVLLFTTKEQLQKCCATSNIAQKRWTQDTYRKNEDS